jgi:pimeloyl-ACP methyl ester carboxylesterase
LRIRPLEPLAAKTKYLVIITNDVKDTGGNGLTRSWTYNALRDTTYGAINDLVPVRNAIVGWETLAKGFLASVTKQAPEAVADKLVLTYTFTTTDPLASLVAVAAPRAALVTAQMNAGVSASDALDTIDLLAPSGALNTPKAVDVGVSALTGVDFNQFSTLLASGVGKLYTGYINLPSYQAPRIESGSFLTAVWQPNTHLALLLGQQLPTDVDGSVNHTYRFPFAAKQATLSRPLQVTLPEKTWIPGYAGVATCEQIYASTGYPTVIYVHGITSDRTSVLALAHTLASRCISTVAIDLPLHGVPANSAFVNALNVEKSKLIPFATLYGDKAPSEGHLNLGGSAGNPVPMNFESPTAADGSGAHFINLANLTNTRDSLRQAVVNLLHLNASLGDLSEELAADHGVGLNTDNLYVVGSSLGGIVGSVYTTVNQLAITYDGLAGFDSPFYPIKGLVTSGAGTQVSQILVNSATFAPVINGGLAASGVNAGTTNYERFMYAAQSAMDAGDPVNFLPSLKALNVPVLIQEIANDAVIPNSTSKAPLAGTAPMAALVGADKAKVGAAETTRNYVRVLAGGHSSLLRPEAGAPDVTAELQAQVVTFVMNQGKPVIGMAAPTQIDQ